MVQSQVVLVGGGTGFVGRHLVNCLVKGGAKVRVLTRKPAHANHISWDSIKSKGLPQDTTAVVNVAGRNILDPVLWTQSFKQEVYASRIESNKLLVEAIHKSAKKPRAFIAISGVGYYKPSDTFEYDETWTQQATSEESGKKRDSSPPSSACNYLMELAKDWENSSLLDEKSAQNTRRVIIRSGVVIGPDGGIVKNLLLPFKLGLGGPIGNGKQWFPWIHVDDLANMFKFAIINEHVNGIINGVAPQQLRNEEFARTFANLLNRPSFIPLPKFAVNLMFGQERADILLKGQLVKSSASLLGFRYTYPNLLDACRNSLKLAA